MVTRQRLLIGRTYAGKIVCDHVEAPLPRHLRRRRNIAAPNNAPARPRGGRVRMLLGA
jgi:hypothetical protein